MKSYQRIAIITRPREATGFYEYFVQRRTVLRRFRESREARLFERALQNISRGENPSGWILTRPSPKDKGIQLASLAESSFIRWGADLYYFPNEDIRQEWLDYHWEDYILTEAEQENMMGRPVLQITGTNCSDG